MFVMFILQYFLYIMVRFDKQQNGMPIAFIVIEKSRENYLNSILQSLHNICQTIGCLMI
jgi:hypothetical protein